MAEERSTASTGEKRQNALELGPRKKPCTTDPLVHHGRHFCRTVHALCNVSALLTNGIVRLTEERPDEELTEEERREAKVYRSLMKLVPGLEERIIEGSEEEVFIVSELIRKGISGARGDDTKGLKGPVLDWITPKGQALVPPLSRNVKADRGFHHERTGVLLCPAGLDWTNQDVKEKLRSGELEVRGDQWPTFLYAGYNYDPEDPWNGLLRSAILVSAFKHIFTSPSSVDQEPKATRSGNARIHGMQAVTPGSLAYTATQVRFALSSTAVFSRTDTVTDSERFYNSLMELLDDPEEILEVDDLILWWNRQVFPSFILTRVHASKNSALFRIREKRKAMKEAATAAQASRNSESELE